MDFISKMFGYPLGWIMWLCYTIIQNYGISLILFTVITKLLLLPLGIKQQKSQAKMAVFQPKMAEIQKKYANNKEKMNEEMTALYQKEGYNPMSGCLPMLIQFPILFGLIDVIYRPLTHILHLSAENIEKGVAIATNLFGPESALVRQNIGMRAENLIFKALDPASGVSGEFVSQWGQGLAEKVAVFNQNFFGLDLAQTPSLPWDQLNWLLIIPLLSGLTAFISSRVSMKVTQAASGQTPGMGGMNMMMTIMMPLMSLWIAFQVPAGVGFYWALSNVLAMAQMWYLNKKYNPKEMVAQAKADEEARKERERAERAEMRKKMQSGEYQDEMRAKALKQKELNREKLAAARKRNAEKYGEEYTEVSDDDLK